MNLREKLAWYVLRGELIDNEELDEQFAALGGAAGVESMVEKAEWLLNHIAASTLAECFDLQHVRVCSHCGKPMGWGYCIEGGCEHYCSDACLHSHYSEAEWRVLYNNGRGDSYYTAWID